MISGRFLVPLLALLGVALLPTLRHAYFGHEGGAPKVVETQLPAALDGTPGVPKVHAAQWVRTTYAADSWAERSYSVPGRGTIRVFVARGYDMKKLYHHPELGLLRGRSFEPLRTESLLPGGRLVRVLRNSTDGESAVYGFVYGGRWIDNPYLLQLSSSITSLWHGRQPLTLIFAYGDVLEGGRPSAATSRLMGGTATGLGAAGDGSAL